MASTLPAAGMGSRTGKSMFSIETLEASTSFAFTDAIALVRSGAMCSPILVDQGEDDQFLEVQLHSHLLEAACREAGQPLELRRGPGYDHSYWFIQTFVADHLEHHARGLAD